MGTRHSLLPDSILVHDEKITCLVESGSQVCFASDRQPGSLPCHERD